MSDLNTKIKRLKDALDDIERKGIDLNKKTDLKKAFHDFKEKKESYYISSIEGSFNDLKKSIVDLASEHKNQDVVLELMVLWKEIEKNRTELKKAKEILARMEEISSKISLPKAKEKLAIKIPDLPNDIRSELTADIIEIQKCFDSGLYRSATILCGRILETALHRKHYEATGIDLLEKSPGIGLGNLIARLKEKNVEIDPALTQQIHLINQVRIFTVHKKKEAFMPSREQTHAIILYTMDIVNRMF